MKTSPRTMRRRLELEALEDRSLLSGTQLTIDALSVTPIGHEGDPFSFSARASSPEPGPLTYTWNFGDGSSDSGTELQETSHAYLAAAASATLTVTLTVSDGVETVSVVKEITVLNRAPVVDAGPSLKAHAGSAVAFSGLVADVGGTSSIASVRWDFDHDGAVFQADPSADGMLSPSHIFATPGLYLVALQAIDVAGQSTLSVTSVTVKPADALIANGGPDQDAVVGEAVTFAGGYSFPGGSVNPSQIAWDMNCNGSSFNPTVTGTLTPSYTFSYPGVYHVALRVVGTDGSTDLSVLEVVAGFDYEGPTAAAGPDQTIAQAGVASFSGSFTDPDGTVYPSNITWDFDYDGLTFTPEATGSLTPTHQYLASGSYQVALRVVDDHGLESLDVLTMTVENVAPTVSIDPTGAVAQGLTVPLSAFAYDPGGSADPVTLEWDFAYDGTTFNPSGASGTWVYHTFTSTGIVTVAVRATDRAGGVTIQASTVPVMSVVGLVVDAGPGQLVAQGDTVSFDADYTTPDGPVDPDSIDWDFDYDGYSFTADPSAHGTLTPEHVFTSPGTYLVGVRMTDGAAHTTIGTLYVRVDNVAPDVLPGDDVTVSEGGAVNFAATATDAGGPGQIDLIEWDFAYDGQTFTPDGSATGSLTPSHTFASAGDHWVALRVTDVSGAVSLQTMHVVVEAVAPTAVLTVSGPATEGSAVSFTLSSVYDLDPDDFLWLGSGGGQFEHIYDDNGTYTVTVRVMDADGASTDYQATVVVQNAAPTGSLYVPSATIGAGMPVRFLGATDSSHADVLAGLTYFYSVNGGPYQASASPLFFLPAYTPDTSYTISGYLQDKDGGMSSVSSTTVYVVATQTVVGNAGSGTVQVGGLTVGPYQYAVFEGAGAVDVTLLTDDGSYVLYTNGSFGQVAPAAGVGSVQLSVVASTAPESFLFGLSLAPGSEPPEGLLALYGPGNIGTVVVPAGDAARGPSMVSVAARGDVDTIVGPGSGSKTWAEAANLYFDNLTGSITGLDRIGGIYSSGSIGDGAGDLVSVNDGIGTLIARGVAGTVNGDRNASDAGLGSMVQLGQGGVTGSLTLGTVASFEGRGEIHRVAIRKLAGPFVHRGPGDIHLLVLGGTAQAPGGQAPKVEKLGPNQGNDYAGILGVKGKDTAKFQLKEIKVPGELNLTVHGSLEVTDNIEAGEVSNLGVSKNLTAKNILVKKGLDGMPGLPDGLEIGGNLEVAEKLRVGGTIKEVDVKGKLTAGEVLSDTGDIELLSVGGDAKASVRAPKGTIGHISVGASFTASGVPRYAPTKQRVLVEAKEIHIVSATGDLGDKQPNRSIIVAEKIHSVVAGARVPDGVGKQGNLLTDVLASQGDLLVLDVNGDIHSTVHVRGGYLGKVKAGILHGTLRAERVGATLQTQGNIVQVLLAGSVLGSRIHADSYLGEVTYYTNNKKEGRITAQAGAKFNAVTEERDTQQVLTDKWEFGMAQALTIDPFAGNTFRVVVLFTYGKAPPAERVKFANGADLLKVGNDTWEVEREKGAEATVYLKSGTFDFTGGAPVGFDMAQFVKDNTVDTATKDWAIKKVMP